MSLPTPLREWDAQRKVMHILSEILEVEEEGISSEDSFYDFGGTSLQAMRICTRVDREIGVSVAPEQLFESDTLADFVTAITEKRASS